MKDLMEEKRAIIIGATSGLGKGVAELFRTTKPFNDYVNRAVDYARVIEWNALGGKPRPLFHQPHWPNDETLIHVYAKH